MTIEEQVPASRRQRVRMKDVAERCGVSVSTVSLVLAGDERIPEATTRKVLQAVKALEYRPSALARALAKRHSKTVGIVLPESGLVENEFFYGAFVQALHSALVPSGFKVLLETATETFLERRYYLRI